MNEGLVHSYGRLVDLVSQLMTHRDYRQVIASGMAEIRKVLQADRSTLFLLNEQQQLVGWICHPEIMTPLTIPLDRGIVGYVARTGQALNLSDAYQDPRFERHVDRSTGYLTRSLLTVPLVTPHQKLLGVIQVLNKEEGGVFTAEDQEFLSRAGCMLALLVDNLKMWEDHVAKERLSHELTLARRVQESLLPPISPDFLPREFKAYYRPTHETGGDFYQLFRWGNRRVMLLGDISGHGLHAALQMANARSTLRGLLFQERPVTEWAPLFHSLMQEDFESGHFLTMLFLAIDPQYRRVEWFSAGHEPFFLWDAVTKQGSWFSATLPPFGISLGQTFAYAPTLKLPEHGFLFLATDGLREARNDQLTELGQQTIEHCLQKHAEGSAGEIQAAVVRRLESHLGGIDPQDDICFLLWKF